MLLQPAAALHITHHTTLTTCQGYGGYLVLQYVLLVLLVLLIGLAAWLAAAVKKDDHMRRRYSKCAGTAARHSRDTARGRLLAACPRPLLRVPPHALAHAAAGAAPAARCMRRLIWVVRSLCWVLLVVFPVACLDHLGASFSCNWQAWPSPTLTWHTAAGAGCQQRGGDSGGRCRCGAGSTDSSSSQQLTACHCVPCACCRRCCRGSQAAV